MVYQFTGRALYYFASVAAVLPDLSGKAVRHTPAEKAAFVQHLQARGLPSMVVKRIIGFMTNSMTDIKNER